MGLYNTFIKRINKASVVTYLYLALALFALAAPFFLPTYIDMAFEAYVGPSVVKITLLNNEKSGGTGFLINTKDGVKVLTNAHICNALPEKVGLAFLEGYKSPFLMHVEKISEKTDLCLASGVHGQSGLSLGSEPYKGAPIAVLGFPQLNPMTLVRGSIISNQIVSLVDVIKNKKECSGPGRILGKDRIFIFEVLTCTRVLNSYLMTTQIYPGNSGSPVLNLFGQVVGIVFATDSTSYKGHMIGVEEIKEFLGDRI